MFAEPNRNRRVSDYPQAYQRDRQLRSTTFSVLENAASLLLVRAWLYLLASTARSSPPPFPEHHLIKKPAPIRFGSGRLLIEEERIAKGDRDFKVKVLRNLQDRFGLFRLPH